MIDPVDSGAGPKHWQEVTEPLDAPVCRAYHFLNLLSQNNLCQSWEAVRLSTGDRCLVKTLAPCTSLDPDSARTVLLESYRLQREIKSARVITANRRHAENGDVFIEYPLLDRTEWQALGPAVLWRYFSDVFPQVCVITDALHALGLVHCDLRLDNFLVRVRQNRPEVVLIDLDFLSPANIKPGARILGTPGHIAPEILDNYVIVTPSDNYSLGVSLREFAHAWAWTVPDAPGMLSLGAIDALVAKLTERDCYKRPASLVECLAASGLLSNDQVESMPRRLFAMTALVHFRSARRNGLDSPAKLLPFFRLKVRLLGISDELIKEFALAFGHSPLGTLRIFRRFMAQIDLSQHVDYWVVNASDELLLQAYRELNVMSGRLPAEMCTAGALPTMAESIISDLIETLVQDNRPEEAFLLLDDVCRVCAATWPEDVRRRFVLDAANLAQDLGRVDSAKGYWRQVLDLFPMEAAQHSLALNELARQGLREDDLDGTARYVNEFRTVVATTHDELAQLFMRRLEGQLALSQGEYDRAEQAFREVFDRAIRGQHWETAVQSRYLMGSVCHYQSRFDESKDHYAVAYELAGEHELREKTTYVPAVLAGVYSETGEYGKAIDLCRAVVRILGDGRDRHQVLAHVFSTMAWAYLRRGDYSKSEHRQQQALSVSSVKHWSSMLQTHHTLVGCLRARQGRIAEAMEAWYRVLNLDQAEGSHWSASATWRNMAEWLIYQGRAQAAVDAIQHSRRHYAASRMTRSMAELDLLQTLIDYYYGDSVEQRTLLDHAQQLLAAQCRYFAVKAAFVLMLEDGARNRRKLLELLLPLRPIMRASGTPLFEVADQLLTYYEDTDCALRIPVTVWKQVYTRFFTVRHRFNSMLVAMRIAQMYQDEGRFTVARKFLLQALQAAQALENVHYTTLITRQLNKVERSSDDYVRVIQSFSAISDILRDLTDYHAAVKRFVEFAVDQTGAERGVLLLNNAQHPGLHVAASLNCDDASLQDIADFSVSIPRVSIEELEPLVVENALTDDRTRKYESIALHNIMSVACVPLVCNGEPIGALYLDHHTIPALFSEHDVKYIQSIANFISIALTTARDFRSIGLKNMQLRHELQNLRGPKAFVTQNRKTLDLLARLPDIARAPVPVLIYGGSGTGKEILCDLLHSYGQRADKPLIKFNCAALSENLIESELFGIEKGVATGVLEREGKFAAADGGTLFLDEVGDMPLSIQSKILRAVEYQQFERVGSTRTTYVDCRFIYATNRDLALLVSQGRFREDLYHRISTVEIHIPPLRDRKDDIPLLISHVLSTSRINDRPPRFTAEALRALAAYDWPGNVREIKNVIERIAILHPGESIRSEHLPPEIQRCAMASAKGRALEEEARELRAACEAHPDNQSAAARSLGMPLTSFRRKLRKHGLS